MHKPVYFSSNTILQHHLVMKKLLSLNPYLLIFNLLPISVLMRMDSVTANLRHGDLVGASLELLNLVFGSHWHKYQHEQQNSGIPSDIKWFGNLLFSSLVYLMTLTIMA